MSSRSLLTLLLATSLLSAPAFAIGGGGAPVAGASGSASINATGSTDLDWNGLSPPAALDRRSCADEQRGFMQRNTQRPSARRAAVERCEAERAAGNRSAAAH
ncbi:MAG: hypothetical protein ACQGVC_02080 [Myxococcota bacterium]